MIEFNLFEFFGILGVGTFTMFSIAYFIFEYQRLFDTKKHNENAFFNWLNQTLKGNYKDTLLTVAIAIGVYTCGIIAQDITDKLTDTADNTSLATKLPFIKKLLPNEGKLRVKALVKDRTELTHLGTEVFDSAHRILNKQKNELDFFKYGKAEAYWGSIGTEVMNSIEEWCLNPMSKSNPKFVDFVNGIYYTAKNWCYLRSAPVRSELEGIQERIDFSRSLLLIAYLDTLLILIFFITYYLKEIKKGKKNWFMVCNPGLLEEPYKKIFYPWPAVIICIVIIGIGRIGYIAAEKNFNERAMGYYVSQFKYIHEEAVKKDTTTKD